MMEEMEEPTASDDKMERGGQRGTAMMPEPESDESIYLTWSPSRRHCGGLSCDADHLHEDNAMCKTNRSLFAEFHEEEQDVDVGLSESVLRPYPDAAVAVPRRFDLQTKGNLNWSLSLVELENFCERQRGEFPSMQGQDISYRGELTG